MQLINKNISIFLVFLICNACATFKVQYADGAYQTNEFPNNEIEHSFYLIGDAGNSPNGSESEALKLFKTELEKASKNSTALFLGDNIYPKGLPNKSDPGRDVAEHQLDVQISSVKKFKGNAIFIPGNHDWYSEGLKGLKRQEDYVKDHLKKNSFLPQNGCPIEVMDITDNIVLLAIDSEWYLTNWNKHPTMNDECEIKTREKFFDELEGEIKKADGKTTLIAMHHPMFSNGPHGGQYSFKDHMKPIPVLGTIKNIIRKTGGVATADIQNRRYDELRKTIITLSQQNDKVIFLSGHEHSLQYIVQDRLPQIISGAGSKLTETKNIGQGLFSYGSPGFARLDVFKDGSSYVRFYSVENTDVVFQSQVLNADGKDTHQNFESSFPSTKTASIYTKEETSKGGFYRGFWGERYRKYYSTDINVPTVNLDTLYGGLTPIRKGGGHQSKSLRLKDNNGSEYVMRALRKDAVQYLQSVVFKDQYIEGQFRDTYAENFLLDVFTGAHPYAPFAIADLADAVGVYHTNPVLFYVPKQNALGIFNDEFGDELYMIEERADSGHGDKASFGFSNTIISTDDLMNKLNRDEDFVLDEQAYIRARLFDMLIGDWDRHEDQWRWASFKAGEKTMYRPIPRDRDQAFSIMADGTFMGFASKAIPLMRLLQSYDEELKDPKWFNFEPYPLDMALINESDKTLWDEQVKFIVGHLTDEVIDKAFTNFPEEVQDETVLGIKRKLKGRRSHLQNISDTYYSHINRYAVVKGTNKDDWFEIERLANGRTKITSFRIKNGEKADVFHQRVYSSQVTKEIWVYGLDDDDRFLVFGNDDHPVTLRLIGGQNNDLYDIRNGKNVKLYDQKSKPNRFLTNKGSKKLTDNYWTNVYDYKKLKNSSVQMLPSLGANPDDGLKVGFVNTITNYGFERNPFTARHKLWAYYYFATDGFELGYNGEFANVFGSTNLGFDANFTSPNYAVNFFGFGNETSNPEAEKNDGLDVGLDYNRVRLKTFGISPYLIWRGQLGCSFKISGFYEAFEVEETEGRYINQYIGDNIDVSSKFIGSEIVYSYLNKDNDAFPTLGMETKLTAGYKSNVDNSNDFGYLIPELAFDYRLVPNGQLVLATKLLGHLNFGDGYEFYQAASIGAINGLRGYRNQRFTGKNAFVQSTDLRLNLRKLKTGLLPLNIGFYGGFDYGRVWLDDDDSDRWKTSVGGGIFANAAGMMTFNLSAFHSADELLLAFKLGFGF